MQTHEVFDVIVRCTREVIPELDRYEFQPGDSLQDLGANSVDRAEIVTLVLESLSLRIPRVETFGPKTVGELATLLHEKMLCS